MKIREKFNKAADWLVVQYIYNQFFRCLVNGGSVVLAIILTVFLCAKFIAFFAFCLILLAVVLFGAVALMIGWMFEN